MEATKIVGLFIVALLLQSCGSDQVVEPRPNFLLVVTDDQSWLHVSREQAAQLKTPAFDRIANEGLYFSQAYSAAPTCTASRSSILSGLSVGQTGSGGVLWGAFPKALPNYQLALHDAGYRVGFTGKGWGPGKHLGRLPNPAGYGYNGLKHEAPGQISRVDYAANFSKFLDGRDSGDAFSFIYSSFEPHRGYQSGIGKRNGIDPDMVVVPGFLPDNDIVRNDIADYLYEIQWADLQLEKMLEDLSRRNLLDNTLVIVTSDNGMPFPRAKSNLYEYGVRVPLAVRWSNSTFRGKQDYPVSLTSIAPTILNLAGIADLVEANRSLLSPPSKPVESRYAFTGFERHIWDARGEGISYPMRAVHSKEFVFIRNFKPDRWPAGSPPEYADIDNGSPTKVSLLNSAVDDTLLALATAKRPAEELYSLLNDPLQLINLAEDPRFSAVKHTLSKVLTAELTAQADPRLMSLTPPFNNYHYWRP